MPTMDNKLINAVLTIESIEDKGSQIKIKSHGKTFNVWKEKKDGTPTRAFNDYVSHKVGVGTHIGCAYKIRQGEFNGSPYEAKDIVMFEDPKDIKYTPGNGAEGSQIIPTRDFRKEAIGKCRYGFMIEQFKKGDGLTEETLQQANAWATACVDDTTKSKSVTEDTVQKEDVPF